MRKSYRIKVSGKVQNVGFRFYTVKKAKEFDISGFVRNEPDGSVYIEAEGKTVDLDTFRDWCRQGPQWAKVDKLEIQEMPVMDYQGFVVK
ncbi:MAG: acylphosphatase [Bacteroidales bacterium]|nr:acylphosphatase [Bacteroidales bacterium]